MEAVSFDDLRKYGNQATGLFVLAIISSVILLCAMGAWQFCNASSENSAFSMMIFCYFFVGMFIFMFAHFEDLSAYTTSAKRLRLLVTGIGAQHTWMNGCMDNLTQLDFSTFAAEAVLH